MFLRTSPPLKHALNHIALWVVYLALRSYVEYLWSIGVIPGFSGLGLVIAVINASVLESLPEIIFAYYFAYRAFDGITQKKQSRYWYMPETMIVLLISIYLVRLTVYYIIAPHVYNGRIPVSPDFEFRRFMSVFFNFITTTGVLMAIKSIRQQLTLKEREKNLIKEKLQTELKLLRNQINPHFLFNTLNNIYSLARKKSEVTPEAVMKLSGLLSFMIYKSGSDFITVAEEVKLIDDYLDLEKLRHSRFLLEFKKDIDDHTQPIAPLLLMPLVENVFKHGISESRFDSFVKISFVVKNSVLEFSVINSIEGAGKPESSQKIGLHSTRRQLELMYKTYALDVLQDKNIFTVHLKLNLATHE